MTVIDMCDIYLHVVVSVESFAANRARELGRANENLRRSRDPVLALVESEAGRRILSSSISMIFVSGLRGRREDGSHLSSTRAWQPYVECNSDGGIFIIFFLFGVDVHPLLHIHGSSARQVLLLLLLLLRWTESQEG